MGERIDVRQQAPRLDRVETGEGAGVAASSRTGAKSPPFLVPGSGRVGILAAGRLRTVAEGLTYATALAVGSGGDLYVSNRGYGAGPAAGLGESSGYHYPSERRHPWLSA